MKRVKPLLPAVGIFCLALFVRVLYNSTVNHDYYPLHDSLFYQQIGLNLVREHCFCVNPYISTVARAPLWPFILSGISLVLGPNDYFARLFLCLIDSGTCVLIYLFARDLFGRRFGVLAGVIATIYPELYIYDGWLYTEALYTFLLLALCYGLYRLQHNLRRGQADKSTQSAINRPLRYVGGVTERACKDAEPKKRIWIIFGVLLGFLSLTRPNGVIVIGLFIIWALIMARIKLLAWRVTIRGVITTTVLALVMIAPWTARNYLESHMFIPVATGDGTVLLGAYNTAILTTPGYTGGWIDPGKSRPDVARHFPPFTCTPPCEAARESAYKHAAEEWILTHKRTMPYLLTLHFVNMWQPDNFEADFPMSRLPGQPLSQLMTVLLRTFAFPTFILAASGLVVTFRRWRELLFMYFIILLTIAENVVFYGSPRFRAPIEPILILLAVGAIWWLTRRFRAKYAKESNRTEGEASLPTPHQPRPRPYRRVVGIIRKREQDQMVKDEANEREVIKMD